MKANEHLLPLQEGMQLTKFMTLQNKCIPFNYSQKAFMSLLALHLAPQFLETLVKYKNYLLHWHLLFPRKRILVLFKQYLSVVVLLQP